MFAIFASLLFAGAFFGSLLLIVLMVRDKADTILTALMGEHVPAAIGPVMVHTPRRPRHSHRLAPPPSAAMIRRAAAA